MKLKSAVFLISRYLILVALGLFNLSLFYLVFTPITVELVYFVLSIFDEGTRLLAGNIIFFRGIYAEIIAACVAGAAYYLLLILNLSTPMKINKRIKSIAFLLIGFLLVNVIRIVIFIFIAISGQQYFDVAHRIMWHFVSSVLVVLIWFVNVRIFNIKEIPVYTDVSNIKKSLYVTPH
ncbi:MAG: pacearchaeosortase [Nanoarchaeota archaeon]